MKIDSKDELDVYLTEQQAEVGQLRDKIKTLTLAFKAQGSWKENGDREGIWYKGGEFIRAMRRQDTPTLSKLGSIPTDDNSQHGWAIPERYEKYMRKAGASSTPLTGDDSVGSYNGSYLVPVDYVRDVLRSASDNSAMMGLVTQIQQSGITAYYPTTTDSFTWTALTNQNTAKTEDSLTFSRATLSCETYAVWLALTEEMGEDSLVDLGRLVSTMMGESWGTKYDSLCLEDSTYGVLGAVGVNELVMSAGSVGFSDLGPEDLLNLIAELTTKEKRRNARFFLHATVFDFVRKFKDAQGNYIWQQPSEGQPGTIWGYPYTITDGLPSSSDSAVSTSFIVFGNPRTILNGVRVGFEFRIFNQTQSTMEYDQVFLRGRTRHSFVTGLPAAWAKLTTASS
jgi:HK97 family phage major capsid protein